MDIICLQESWLNDTILDQDLQHDEFNLYRSDRSMFIREKSEGGGLLTYVRKTLISSEIQNIFQTHIELQLIKPSQSSNLVIVNTYLPPYSVSKKLTMVKELSKTINHLLTTITDVMIILIGDFNMSTIEWNTRPYTAKTLDSKFFLKIMGELDLDLISRSGVELCLAMPNTTIASYDYNNFPLRSSLHHSPQFYKMQLLTNINKSVEITTKINNAKLNEFIRLHPEVITRSMNIVSTLQSLQKKFTFKRRRKKHPSKPFLNDSNYNLLIKKKKQFLTNSRNNEPTSEEWEEYRNIVRQIGEKFQQLRTSYFQSVVDKSKDFNQFLKESNNVDSELPAIMNFKGKLITGNMRYKLLAELLAQNFTTSTAFQRPENFDTSLHDIYAMNFSPQHSDHWDSLNFQFTLEDVLYEIKSLDSNKNPGVHDISIITIKDNADLLAPVILQQFNEILINGEIPNDWKTSLLIPIPKEAKNKIDKYRGIAIQSVIPKLFDALLTKKLSPYFEKFIPQYQHGFTTGKNTTSNLMETQDYIKSSINRGGKCDVIYFDLSKAFDKLDHGLLLQKLAKVSVRHDIVTIIMKLITNRTYFILDDKKQIVSKVFADAIQVHVP